MTYSPPNAPPRKFEPLAIARYFKGRTSAGIATMMPRDERPTPIRIPPPINWLIPVALAETQEPANAMVSWIEATYLRSICSVLLAAAHNGFVC